MDRVIRGLRQADPTSDAAEALYAYLHGSTDVGGLLKPSDPAKLAEALKPLTGLASLPMTEGYWKYMTGQVGNKDFWDKASRPEQVPYDKTADKVVYRGGWGTSDEYLLLETIGWADHGHMDLGTISQYCQGGRLWIVDYGYNNVGTEHQSTLEVKRDGKNAWGQFKGVDARWGDFRSGPQMFEIVKLDSGRPTTTSPTTLPSVAGPFSIVCRAKGMAGATWERSISGGDGKPLVIKDTLMAEEPGLYEIVFRLRLLGSVEGEKGKWMVRQKGASIPLTLEVADGDGTAIAKWLPDDHARDAGAYARYPFADKGGVPKTIEWRRTIKLAKGDVTSFLAQFGPSVSER